LLPWALEQSRSGRECTSPPKTEPNEGMGRKEREVVAGMLWGAAGREGETGWGSEDARSSSAREREREGERVREREVR
jgi:hypothetical protein